MYEREQLVFCRLFDNVVFAPQAFRPSVTTTAELIDEEGPDGQANPTTMHRDRLQCRDALFNHTG